MANYALYDFTESIDCLKHDGSPGRTDVKRVIAAYGYSPDGWGSWTGGFLMELSDGSFQYLSGWCDTSGWGCRSGIEVEFFTELPSIGDLKQYVPWSYKEDNVYENLLLEWDLDPIDLNKWVDEGMKDPNSH
jgi:hypothetical protein